MSEPEIICERRGAAGFVTLNRPKALNALTHLMVTELAAALDRWERDPEVTRIVVRGAGERAFCAGGDIRALYEAGDRAARRGARLLARRIHLNIRIKRYSQSRMSHSLTGSSWAGGVGVSLHGSHRVAGDRHVFAMPEVAIGFFPRYRGDLRAAALPGRDWGSISR
jgi:enoyl-CoA hydratase